MGMKVFNIKKAVVPLKEQRLFLGEYSGFQRYDTYRYNKLKRIEETMRNNFWNPEEISLNDDAIKFNELDNNIKECFTQNLLYQTTMDSVQTRGLQAALLKVVSMPELEMCFNTQAYFEQIHSSAYSHIVRSLFPDGTAIFDKIDQIPAIKNRMKDEERTSRIIKMIQFDENLHVTLFRTLFDILRKHEREGFVDYFDVNVFNNIFNKVRNEELQWGNYLLSVYDIPGLSKKGISEFMK